MDRMPDRVECGTTFARGREILDSQHAKPVCFEPFCTRYVIGDIPRGGVMAAVYLDDQPRGSTVKVGYVWADRLLPAETQTAKPFAAQIGP